jgi:CBS domain-containing protein
MNVRDIMVTDVPSVRPEDSVDAVARLLLDRRLMAAPVVDAAGRLVGVVRAHDLVARHARVHAPLYFGLLGATVFWKSRGEDEEVRHALAVTAADLMDRGVPTLAPTASVEDVATVIVDKDVEVVPIVENGRVIGLVTEWELVRLLLVEDAGADTH